MKVYVDELPKKCLDCVCCNKVNGRCQLKHLYIDTDLEPIDCPLQSLAEHDKQVRKQVCDEIGRKITMIAKRHPNHNIGFDCEDIQISFLEITSVLDQIQGENNVKD